MALVLISKLCCYPFDVAFANKAFLMCRFSGFNAAVAGCFFAIETVLRPLKAENAPPFTTAMIILASVISSTVSHVLLGERPAFIVPAYELKSAAGTCLDSFFFRE